MSLVHRAYVDIRWRLSDLWIRADRYVHEPHELARLDAPPVFLRLTVQPLMFFWGFGHRRFPYHPWHHTYREVYLKAWPLVLCVGWSPGRRER
ncbi:MAG TPA: hypothetical protein VFT74_16125 [Isosphaeraceae bacterium]|nr:hypothetical protein [Isosphaeraceae bacterium]